MRVTKYAFFRHSIAMLPTLWKLIVSLLLNRVRYTPKQVFVLFASPVKNMKRFALCRPKAEPAFQTSKFSSLSTHP